MEVVIAQTSPAGCFNGANYYISNYGYAGNAFHKPVAVNAEITQQPASEPVVAFYSGEGGDFTNPDAFTNNYLVSWTGTNYDLGQDADIWARTLNAGQVVAPGDYSRVNTEFEGVQRYPSVAARYSGDRESSAHLFANLHTQQLGYKLTPTPAGQPLQRPAAGSHLVRLVTNQRTETINLGKR